ILGLVHCGSRTRVYRGWLLESVNRLPPAVPPAQANLKSLISNGPTMSGTPLPYNIFWAEMLPGAPELRFTIQLACQFSASRAQSPDEFPKRSLPGPIGSSNVP